MSFANPNILPSANLWAQFKQKFNRGRAVVWFSPRNFRAHTLTFHRLSISIIRLHIGIIN